MRARPSHELARLPGLQRVSKKKTRYRSVLVYWGFDPPVAVTSVLLSEVRSEILAVLSDCWFFHLLRNKSMVAAETILKVDKTVPS